MSARRIQLVGRAAARLSACRTAAAGASHRAAAGALSARGAPRPVRRRSEASGQGDHDFGCGVIGPVCIGPLADRGRPRGRSRASCSGGRSNWGDCRQCPLTAIARRAGVSRPTRRRWRIGRSPVRPVLKHGPRSLTCARVVGHVRNPEAQ